MKTAKKIILGLCALSLLGCEKEQPSFSEQFYQGRLCPEITYQCLPESQNNDIKETTVFDPNNLYQLSEEEWNSIKRHNILKMYDEIAQLLDITYPGFWQDKDTAFKRAWLEKVDGIAKKFYPKSQRDTLETMALICAIIGTDFEQNPKFNFITERIKKGRADTPLSAILDYLLFEVLGWEFDLIGYQYNNWSLRSVMETMPRLTRDVPDFDKDFKKQKTQDNPLKEYFDKVYQGGRLK
ncbi:hypothetical protein [Rodentibacter myodis]|uniref:Lipoprotein n=1 Tax=Rodentibacter myodis TaxID=1907939 RepID=A0A1V3JTR9_9PAST|nr:hypothetical protein [Rodentibacter myodis]OOF60059.1 hypothetical protein BKL49_00915 [Rodentibacter myodis]